MPRSLRLPFASSIPGAILVLAAAAGKVIHSDPLIALGIPGGLAIIVAGLIYRTNYRGIAGDYDAWMRSRGDERDQPARRLGALQIIGGTIFSVSAITGLFIY